MFSKLRGHGLSHTTVVAYLGLFVALGGTSYAAVTITGANVRNESLTSRDIKNGSIKGGDLKNGSVTTTDIHDGSINTRDVGHASLNGGDIADGSLLATDFAAGQLPQGQRGPQGERGETGPPGPAGKDGADGGGGGGGGGTVTVRENANGFPAPCVEDDTEPGVFDCTSATRTVRASCADGERATGGGYAEDTTGDSSQVTANRPDPASGTPTGWVVTAKPHEFEIEDPPSGNENAPFVVYAVCEAP